MLPRLTSLLALIELVQLLVERHGTSTDERETPGVHAALRAAKEDANKINDLVHKLLETHWAMFPYRHWCNRSEVVQIVSQILARDPELERTKTVLHQPRPDWLVHLDPILFCQLLVYIARRLARGTSDSNTIDDRKLEIRQQHDQLAIRFVCAPCDWPPEADAELRSMLEGGCSGAEPQLSRPIDNSSNGDVSIVHCEESEKGRRSTVVFLPCAYREA